MPMEQLVLETDCPYLSPVPNRGKRNSSLNLPYVVGAISQMKGISAEEVIEITSRNAKGCTGFNRRSQMAELGNFKNTMEIIQKYEFTFQKKFGQNFLIDTHVLEKIIRAAGVTKDDMVLEIGPGIGTMTQYLAEHARQVVAVEIDKT